jgi:hypothetical protein
MYDQTTEARQRRLEDAIRAVEAKGNTFMAANLRKALRELLDEAQRGG